MGSFFSSSSSRTSNKYMDVACLGTDQNYRTPLKPSKTLQRTNHLGFLGGSKSLSDWPNWPYPHKDQHHIHEFVQPVLQRCRLWQKNRLPWVKQRRCPRQFGVFCYSTSHLNVDVERQNGKMYSWGVAQSDWDILWLTFDPKISIACLRSKYRIDRMYHEMWTVHTLKY